MSDDMKFKQLPTHNGQHSVRCACCGSWGHDPDKLTPSTAHGGGLCDNCKDLATNTNPTEDLVTAVLQDNRHDCDDAINDDADIHHKHVGDPLVIVAARMKHIGPLCALIEAGVDINTVDDDGCNILWWLTNVRADMEVLERMVRCGCDPHRDDNHGLSPIKLALKRNDYASLSALEWTADDPDNNHVVTDEERGNGPRRRQ